MILSRRNVVIFTASAATLLGPLRESFAACGAAKTPMVSINGPPEYLPGAPLRTSFLTGGEKGQRIRLFGKALDTNCIPLAGARLDFWHTDGDGKYDVAGYTFRGAQHIDAQGNFTLDTVMPGPYNGARHVHLLLAFRPNNRPQPLLLSSAVFLPTKEEYAAAKPKDRTPEFIDPDTLQTVAGVLMVPCDIIAEQV